MDRLSDDWVTWDLLKIVRNHYPVKGKADGVWPEVFEILVNEEGQTTLIESSEVIRAGTVVMALDAKPSAGQKAVVRVLHNDGVWVVNSNYVVRKPCTTAKQEKYSL